MAPNRITLVFTLLLGASMLTGCDKLTGAADQKNADAEAIGYACRVSNKTPEDCMKENDGFNPSPILDGWKSADQDIKDKVIVVGGDKSAAADNKPAEDKPAGPPAGEAAKKDEAKPGDAKGTTH